MGDTKTIPIQIGKRLYYAKVFKYFSPDLFYDSECNKCVSGWWNIKRFYSKVFPLEF